MDNEMLAGYALGQDSNDKNNGMWGDGGCWIWIILLFALFGWGGNGFGGFGNKGGNCGPSCATTADVSNAFDFNQLDNGIRGLERGQCDTTFALNNTITNGFHGVDNAVCNLGWQNQQGFNNLSSQLANCCCETQGAIKDVRYDLTMQGCATQNAIQNVRYDMATQDCATRNLIQTSTRDITDNANANTRAILDFLTQDKIAALTAENQNLKFQASQVSQNAYLTANNEAQTAELIRRIAPMPVPAYGVPAPYPYCGSGYNNGCGCSCGC